MNLRTIIMQSFIGSLLCVANFSHAAPVVWTASGSVSGVWGEALAPYFFVGDDVTLRFSYDSQVSALYTSPTRELGIRVDTLSLAVGTQSFALRVPQENWFHPFLAIKNNQPYDELIVGYVELDGLLIQNLHVPEFYFGLVDYTSTRFDSRLLPPMELGNLKCDFYCAFLSYEDPVANTSRRIIFNIRQIDVALLPEPSSMALLSMGVALLLAFFGHRRKNLNPQDRG